MNYYFQESFVQKVRILLKNNSYQDCEMALIESVFNLSVEQIMTNCSAMRLNASSKNPIAKLRISYNSGKSSSYRLYVFAMIIDKKLYFAYLYPKKGKLGQASLSAKQENFVIKELLDNVKLGNFEEVFLDKKTYKICFVKNSEPVF